MIFGFLILYAALGGAAGWALNAYLEVGLRDAGAAGLGLYLTLAVLHLAATRRGPAADLEPRVTGAESRSKNSEKRATVIEARLDAVEATVKHELTERRDALVAEMKQLEGLIDRLSRSFETSKGRNGASAPFSAAATAATADDGVLREVRAALHAGRVDLHLQPVVSLPQRRAAFYEGFSRLRREDGGLILPADFLDAARRARLTGVIDNITMYRCVQIVRRLAERDRRVGVFCNLSTASLTDEDFFPKFREFISTARDLSGALIFEIRADQFEARSREMRNAMDELSALGFRFSLDSAGDIALDLPRLQDAGVRFVKVEGGALLSQLRDSSGPRPVSSLQRPVAGDEVSALFSRYGVTLIAEKLEDEAMVVELLEYDIPYAQGNVFGAPRPIKASLMEETAPPAHFVEGLVNVH